MNVQLVQTTQNESNLANQNGEGEKYPTLKFIEIRPETMNKIVFSKDLCKISFNVFTHNAPVEILYNPIDNTFNAFSLILFNLKNDVNSSDKLTPGKFPVDKLTVGKFPTDENPDKLDQKLRDKAKDILVSWMRNKDNIDFIDRISLMLTGKYHFSYNDKSIWNENGTIIKDILDSKSRVQLDKLTHREDNIVKKINAGNSPVSGTWLNFEFLPEMLRISNMNYRVLANHFQALLLPYLTNQNISFEQATSKLQRKLLWQMEMLNEIDTISNPGEKGKAMERYTTTLLREVFINSEEQNEHNEENVKLISNLPHTCDIQIINEKILVEVKAVKKDLTANDVKFINDILAHPNTINAGIYVNFFDDSIKTRMEFNPLRFYVNRYDFDDKMLTLIKNTIDFYERKLLDTRETNRQFNSIAKVKEIEQAAVDYFYIDFKRILMGVLARAKLDSDLKDLPIHSSDITNPEKLNKDVAVAQNIKEIEEAVKEFIGANYDKFNTEYFTLQAKNDAVAYLTSKGLPNPGVQKVADIFNVYLKTDRSKLSESKKLVYVFKPEQLHIFDEHKNKLKDSSFQEENVIIESNESVELPNIEEISDVFFSKPENIQAINDEKGIKQDVLAARFRNFIKTDYQEKYKLNPSKYTIAFQSQALKHCVQFGKDKKHHKYISKELPKAQEYLNTLRQMINEEYEKDNKLNYSKFNAIYKSKINADDRLTKPIVLSELNSVIKGQK